MKNLISDNLVRRLTRALVAALASVLIVAACTPTPSQQSATQTLTILSTDTDPGQMANLQSIIAKFEAANPGTKVSFAGMDFTTLLTNFNVMDSAGRAADVVIGAGTPLWGLYTAGRLQPVTAIVMKLGEQSFKPGALTKIDGEYYMIPYELSVQHIEYRADLFKAAGISTPTTWTQFVAACKALTKDGTYGSAFPFGRTFALDVNFASLLWSNGGHILDKSGKVAFNSPQAVQTMTFLKQLWDSGCVSPAASQWTWGDMVSSYQTGKIAMTWYSSLRPLGTAVASSPTVASGTAVMPIPPGPSSVDGQPRLRAASTAISIPLHARNVAAARSFVEFFLSPTNLIGYYHVNPLNYMTPIQTVSDNADYFNNATLTANKTSVDQFLKLIPNGVSEVEEYPGVINPLTSKIINSLIISDAVQSVILKNVAPETAVTNAAQEMQKLGN